MLESLAQAGKAAVIPSKANRRVKRDHGRDLYKARHLIENFFAKLKQFRAIATRYDKTARNFLGAIHLAAAAIWLNGRHALDNGEKTPASCPAAAVLHPVIRGARGAQHIAHVRPHALNKRADGGKASDPVASEVDDIKAGRGHQHGPPSAFLKIGGAQRAILAAVVVRCDDRCGPWDRVCQPQESLPLFPRKRQVRRRRRAKLHDLGSSMLDAGHGSMSEGALRRADKSHTATLCSS